MNAPQRITLKAFLIALAHQEQPLSAELQTQLKEISQDIPSNLGKLNYLGNTYLKELYPQVRASLQKPAAERNLGRPAEINEEAERRNAEISNQVDAIDRMDDETLTQNAKEIFSQADNWEKILQIIAGFWYPVL
jgi:DNA anti-recombination protein RmuC